MRIIWHGMKKAGFISTGSVLVLESYWKVIEIENVIFQDLEVLDKRWLFIMAMEKFRIFAWKGANHIQKWM